jgi:hypothetical protein
MSFSIWLRAWSLSTVPPCSSLFRAASSAFVLPSSSAVFFLANSWILLVAAFPSDEFEAMY